jgi:hypothetical protein
VLLDANKKTLTVYTSTEVTVELPKESATLIPAIQLKSGKALIGVRFERPFPP